MAYLDAFRQCFFIPKPTFTEKELPDQAGRVFIVTGGYTGVGKELASMLYGKNGTVYLAGRSENKAKDATAAIKAANPNSDGRLEYLHLDLADLPTIKSSVEDFKKREQRLDVLTNNAGVMTPPVGSKTAQNYELQMGTNCLGPFLFTELLTPLLQKTSASSPAGSVRVTWAASLATMAAPSGGIKFDPATGAAKVHGNKFSDYAQSKASNVHLAREYQERYGASGIVSNAWNPGNLRTELQRHQTLLEGWFTSLLVYEAKLGGITELFAGWAPEPGKAENKDKYIGPWGRFCVLKKDIESNREGGKKFWEWCDKETKQYR